MRMPFERNNLHVSLITVLAVIILSTAAWATGCGTSEPAQPVNGGENGGGRTAGEDVTLTLFFGYSAEAREWLVAEERTVTDVTDPCRTAMEELIKGPEADPQLYPVLPDTVRVLDTEVADGTCTVNVSAEILTDADQVGGGAYGEILAFSAIANTLTTFPEVSRVRLLVEGVQSGMVEGRMVEDFWGHVGLPEFLEWDESIIYR